MPIIPRYNLTQTSTHVHIEVSIPHVRVSTSTLDLAIVDGTELHLYAPPTYLLKLTLPGRVLDEDAVEDSLSNAANNNNTSSSGMISVIEEEEGEDDKEDGSSAKSKSTTPIKQQEQDPQIIWTKEDLPKLQYNPEKNHGTLVAILRKEEEGFWQDLDLLGRLQQQPKTSAPKKQQLHQTSSESATMNKPLIQVVDSQNEAAANNINESADIENEDMPTSEVMDDLLSINQNRPTYGLFQHYSNVFRDYAREGLVHEMLECPNPDEVYTSTTTEAASSNSDGERGECSNEEVAAQQNRREMRLEMENEKFDSGRYLNDLYIEEEGDMIFDSAMSMVPHYSMMKRGRSDTGVVDSVEDVTNQLSQLSTNNNQAATATTSTFFTPEESHLLATLSPQKSNQQPYHLLSPEQKQSAFLSLTDILFAYAFDHRTTDGDPTVESSWTIMILSPSLSWLENYNPPYDTIADCFRWNIRRSLIYPYLRSYTLARKIVQDVRHIVKGGRRPILRCLLQVHQIMEKSEAHYLFNKLYVDPLIGWIQRIEEEDVQGFGREMENVLSMNAGSDDDVLGKEQLGLGLVRIEKSFLDCYNEEDESASSSDDEDSDDEDEDSADNESDSDSRGEDKDTVGTTDEDEGSPAQSSSDVNGVRDKVEEEEANNAKSSSRNSSSLLDENIGVSSSAINSATFGGESEGKRDTSEWQPPKRLIEEA